MLLHMVRWQPIHPGKTVVSVVFTSVPAMFLIFLVASLVTGGATGDPRDVIIFCCLVALMTAAAWRITRAGVYLSERGVRVRYLVGSDVVDWADLHRVVVRTRRRGWSILSEEVQEIWLVRREGEPVDTSVTRSVDRPWDGRLRTGTNYAVSSDPTFYRTLEKLEDGLARWRETRPVPSDG